MKLIFPWNNLGCLAFKTKNIYVDFFLKPYFGMFFSHHKMKRGREVFKRKWYKLPYFQLVKNKTVEIRGVWRA